MLIAGDRAKIVDTISGFFNQECIVMHDTGFTTPDGQHIIRVQLADSNAIWVTTENFLEPVSEPNVVTMS